MLGMDPVLTGSLCFLVLAIVMYVKFIREHPMSEEESRNHRTNHHHRLSSGPIEPDMVPFLNPVSSPLKVLQQQKKFPLSPPRHVGGGNGLKQQNGQRQHPQQQGYYHHAAKQPMRRRAHSAATTTPNPHLLQTMGVPPMTIIDAELGLNKLGSSEDSSNDERRGERRYSEAYEPIDMPFGPPSSSFRIDFGEMEFEDQESGLLEQFHRYEGPLDAVGEHDDLDQRPLPAAVSMISPAPQHRDRRSSPAPFMIGGGDGGGIVVEDVAPLLVTPPKQQHQDPQPQENIKTMVIERQFVRDAVAQPAQMQLEVARKARIPLFLHSPIYVKTSAAPVPDDALPIEPHQQYNDPNVQVQADPQGPVKPANTPRNIKDKLPPKCHKNNSLHIDFQELRLADMIGQGAFGTVHRATWRGTTVAVKILVCQHLTKDILEEFETEVQIMSILRHPNICLLMGACLEPPSRCLVIEYLPRGSLWNVLRQDTVIDASKQISFARDTALGMNYLHAFQPPILHRDLKSPNLLVDLSYAIKISDFGLARVRAHFQTMTGNCGTTQWMAPEVLAAEKYTEKADVFSYGVVCWEIITRACPYDGLCQIQAALGVLNNNLRPTIPPDCPPLFKKLMTLCWVSAPEKRPTFAQILELVQHLDDETYLDGLAPPPHGR